MICCPTPTHHHSSPLLDNEQDIVSTTKHTKTHIARIIIWTKTNSIEFGNIRKQIKLNKLMKIINNSKLVKQNGSFGIKDIKGQRMTDIIA